MLVLMHILKAVLLAARDCSINTLQLWPYISHVTKSYLASRFRWALGIWSWRTIFI
jgi:hypothetical protein